MIAEFVDVFRILGFDDQDDMVCQGTRLLLDRQLPNRGWGGSENGKPYDPIHLTWVGVDAPSARPQIEASFEDLSLANSPYRLTIFIAFRRAKPKLPLATAAASSNIAHRALASGSPTVPPTRSSRLRGR